MKTLKTTFSDVLSLRSTDAKKIQVSEDFLYEITLALVVVSIITSGFIFALAF